MADIHVGDEGTTLQVIVQEDGSALDISSATTKEITLKAPDGTSSDKTASFTTDGTDGKVEYDTQAGDIDQKGIWHIQAYVEMPDGKWHTETDYFGVEPNV